jgi:hypothetical protein
MIWHYDKDLSHYTWDKGAIIARRNIVIFGAVTWRQRTENWSWELGGSASWSHSRKKTERSYPLLNLIPAGYRTDASTALEEGFIQRRGLYSTGID